MKNEMPNLKQKIIFYGYRHSEALFPSYDLLTGKKKIPRMSTLNLYPANVENWVRS
jgi:hypothetical protein